MPEIQPDPAIGSDQQPFAGIATFMRRAPSRKLKDVDVAILGVPFDSGTSYRSGARFGPRKIREASLQLWGHHAALGVTPTEVLNIIDYGDVEVIPVDIVQTQTAITSEVASILEAGVTAISLGETTASATRYCGLMLNIMARWQWCISTPIQIPGRVNILASLSATGRLSAGRSKPD